MQGSGSGHAPSPTRSPAPPCARARSRLFHSLQLLPLTSSNDGKDSANVKRLRELSSSHMERAGGAALPTDAGQGAEQANETAVDENEVSWSTSTWLALQAQRLSVAVHIASAWKIATEMQLAGGGGQAPSSDEEGAATA
jgi:hypothetical protein